MGNVFKRIFGIETRKPNISPAALPRSISDDPAGSLLNQRILERMKGEGIGFGPDFVERSTSPMVAQLRADLPGQISDIQGYYSGMGLGRSTPAARQQGEFRAQHGRDINQILSQAYFTDLQQRKADEARYEGLAGDIASKNIGLQSAAELQRRSEQLEDYKMGTERDQAKTSALNRVLAAAGNIVSPFLSGGSPTLVASGVPSGVGGMGGVQAGFISPSTPSFDIKKILSMLTSMGGV